MSLHSQLIEHLTCHDGSEPFFAADLVRWRVRASRLEHAPDMTGDSTPGHLYRDLRLPIWETVRPWLEESPGLEVAEETSSATRTRTIETASGPLVWHWELQPDGAWRQTGYPVSGPADLPAALLWARAMSYALDTAGLTELEAAIGTDGVLAIELPPQPAIMLAGRLIGWERAQDLFKEPAIVPILEALGQSWIALATALAQLSPIVLLSPDRLSTEISTLPVFHDHLLPEYSAAMEELREYRKLLLVTARGDVSSFARPLLETGVTGLAGVAPAPGEVGLGALSASLDERLCLWGGIPAGVLQPSVDAHSFEESVRQAAADAAGHRGILLGLTGHLAPEADLSRLQAIPELIRSL